MVEAGHAATCGNDPGGTYEKQVIGDFGTVGAPDLLIVVDKLLTGFDEPRNTVLYIDKPLKGTTLIQAVARVNRLHDAKRYGVLVDYRGILKELDRHSRLSRLGVADARWVRCSGPRRAVPPVQHRVQASAGPP